MRPGVVHRAAGLTIAADRSIPGLPAGHPTDPSDVVIHIGASPPWQIPDGAPHFFTAEHTDAAGRPVLRVRRTRDGFQFQYADETNIWVAGDGCRVWCTSAAAATLEDTATYLAGPILGFLLRLRGALAFHASAVQIGRSALVLVGSNGAGKSTAAAALGRRGCAVVTDDVLHVRRETDVWLAEPFAGWLRLWNDGAALALGDQADLPCLTPTWEKRGLELGTRGVDAVREAIPVGAIAFLEPRTAEGVAPRLDPVTPAEALVRLAAHSSAAHLLDQQTRGAEFTMLGSFVRGIPCIRGTAASDPDRFGAFIDLVHQWALERCAADGL